MLTFDPRRRPLQETTGHDVIGEIAAHDKGANRAHGESQVEGPNPCLRPLGDRGVHVISTASEALPAAAGIGSLDVPQVMGDL